MTPANLNISNHKLLPVFRVFTFKSTNRKAPHAIPGLVSVIKFRRQSFTLNFQSLKPSLYVQMNLKVSLRSNNTMNPIFDRSECV